MRIIETKIYSYDELTDEGKEKAIEGLANINVELEWWDSVYEDGERINFKISGFDIDRGAYCSANFKESAEDTAHLIEKEHGESCETFSTAENYLEERDKTIDEAPRDENGDFECEYTLDKKLDELDAEFLQSLQEDYRIILQKEYEYLTSEKSIIETIQANEYEFTENGKLI